MSEEGKTGPEKHLVCVICEGLRARASLEIPQLDLCITGPRCKAAAAGMACNTQHPRLVPCSAESILCCTLITA